MYENNEATPAKPTYEELEAKASAYEQQCQNLEAQVTTLTNERNNWQHWHNALSSKVDKAEEGFKEILAGDMDAKDIIETYGEVLSEHLGWEFNNEVEIEIQVTWRGTINLPYGTEVSDLDIDDFGLNEPCHNEYDTNFWNGIHDYSIDER